MEKRTMPQTAIGDDQIIDMYWERNPDAIQETDQKYGSLLRKVAYNVLFDDLDCEECKNDTYLRIWNSIPTTKPTAFSAFITHITRCIAIDRYKTKHSKKRIPSHLIAPIEELKQLASNDLSLEDAYDAKVVGALITEYLRGLDDRQKYIFMDRYYMAEPVEKIAADLSISVRTTYREIDKLKQGLREYLEKNGVHI